MPEVRMWRVAQHSTASSQATRPEPMAGERLLVRREVWSPVSLPAMLHHAVAESTVAGSSTALSSTTRRRLEAVATEVVFTTARWSATRVGLLGPERLAAQSSIASYGETRQAERLQIIPAGHSCTLVRILSRLEPVIRRWNLSLPPRRRGISVCCHLLRAATQASTGLSWECRTSAETVAFLKAPWTWERTSIPRRPP